MKFRLIVIFVIFLSSNVIADKGFEVVPKEIQEEKRVALVIGNSSYQRPLSILNNTINDAVAIKNILIDRGFNVIYRENITKRGFTNVLEKFYQELGKGGTGLLYFSGHGLESSGQNYLLPIDANIRAKSDTEFEAIALNRITKRMQNIGNRLNIVILDACRNDPFVKASNVGGLVKSEPIGLFVSYATGAGKVASDGRMGENGLFTKYLIKYMKQPLSLQKVFKKTRASVYSDSAKTQFPAIYDQTINGDFYFTLPQREVDPTPIVQTSTLKWISPTKRICESNGGEVDKHGLCKANWNDANKICFASGKGRLANIEELKKVVIDCGAGLTEISDNKQIITDKDHQIKINSKSQNYRNCYEKKGFTDLSSYWSSTRKSTNDIKIINFYGGFYSYYRKNIASLVRCVSVEQ